MTTLPIPQLSARDQSRPSDAKAQLWVQRLRQVGYYIPLDFARTVAFWWEDRGGPLLLEGPPGGGKTRLAEAIKEAMGLEESFYRLQCYRSIGKRQALYDWDERLQEAAIRRFERLNPGRTLDNAAVVIYDQANLIPGQLARALMDPNPHTLLLVDEIDKVPAGEGFEALLLEYLGEHKITVAEANRRISPATGTPPHTVITSNAGVDNSSLVETLSYPILRRALYRLYIKEPDLRTRYKILRSNAPRASSQLIADVVLFCERLSTLHLTKAVSISESINWIRLLEWIGAEELTPELVISTMGTIVKLTDDDRRLEDSARSHIKALDRLRSSIDVDQCERELACPSA